MTKVGEKTNGDKLLQPSMVNKSGVKSKNEGVKRSAGFTNG